jgi:hypothetical protein
MGGDIPGRTENKREAAEPRDKYHADDRHTKHHQLAEAHRLDFP